MSTQPTPSPTPSSTLDNILNIINEALGILSIIPALKLPIAIEQSVQRILTKALQSYNQEAGLPFDLTKIPQEAQITK